MKWVDSKKDRNISKTPDLVSHNYNHLITRRELNINHIEYLKPVDDCKYSKLNYEHLNKNTPG